MIHSLFDKIRSLKAGIDLLPVLLERLEEANVSQRAEALLSSDKYADERSLARHRFKVFSQCGQDGVLAEIFRRIGDGDRRFVEIGTAPLENNTGFLLLQGWSGLWVDAALPPDESLPANLQKLLSAGRLQCDRIFVTKENILSILQKYGFNSNIDLLGIDVDYNTYHILDACLAARPRVLSVEYNAQLPAWIDWVVPYHPEAVWDKSINYGASLKAIERRASKEGYALVGCELSGTDAFFVREDLLGNHFHGPYTAEHHWEPLRFWLDSSSTHERSFLSGTATR